MYVSLQVLNCWYKAYESSYTSVDQASRAWRKSAAALEDEDTSWTRRQLGKGRNVDVADEDLGVFVVVGVSSLLVVMLPRKRADLVQENKEEAALWSLDGTLDAKKKACTLEIQQESVIVRAKRTLPRHKKEYDRIASFY